MRWAFIETGLLAYSTEEVYYLGVNLKKETANKVKRIDFKINRDRLYIKKVNGCPNPQYILICLSNKYDE